jgi:hypothetical protein
MRAHLREGGSKNVGVHSGQGAKTWKRHWPGSLPTAWKGEDERGAENTRARFKCGTWGNPTDVNEHSTNFGFLHCNPCVTTKTKGIRSLHSKQYCMGPAIVRRLGASFGRSEVAINCRDAA